MRDIVHMGRLRHKVNGPNETPMIHSIRGAGSGFAGRSLSPQISGPSQLEMIAAPA
jgi:hypothetical protein